MKALPYLLLIASFGFGYVGMIFPFVVALAVASTLLFMAPRRKQLREQPQAPDQNMLLDGAFLLFQQMLVHFLFYALGIFIARMVGG